MLTSYRLRCYALLIAAAGLNAGAQPGDPAGLWAQSTLYRDEWGVPHVFADTPQALGFAFGYAQAEDHLLDMLLAYRTVNGRAAMVLGEASANSDAFALKMNHARLAREAFPTLDPATQALCTGFAQGVNLFELEHAAELPEWAEGVQPQDILALWHSYIMSGAPYDMSQPYTRPRAAQTGNAWALAPARTAENKTVLVINPHQYFDGPFRWYEAHLRLGDTDVAGATLFGLPVILQGHNHVLGWAMTPNQPDFADLFSEEFAKPERNPKNPNRSASNTEQALVLMYMSQAQSYLVNTPSGMQERFVPAFVSSRGPVFENGSELLSWRIGGYFDFGGLGQLMAMAAAQTLEQFQQALAMQQLPSFNILYADAPGRLFYLYNAKSGVRNLIPGSEEAAGRAVVNWKSPVPGEWDLTAWSATIPITQLPSVVDPQDGYLQACNTAPWFATTPGAVPPGAWPAWLISEADTYRGRRARQLLEHGTRSFREVQAMLYDIVLPAAADLAPRLVSIAEAHPQQAEAAHPDLLSGLLMLRDWNYVAEADSAAMTFYQAWWDAMRQRAGKQYTADGPFYDWLLRGEPQAQEMMFSAAADATRLMRNQYQSISVGWGEVHRIRRGDRDEPMPGAATGDPLFVAQVSLPQEGKGYVDYGYGFAMAVQFGGEPEAWSVVPFGASEVAGSQHYSDQLDLLLERRLKKTRFLEDDVLRHAVSARGRVVRLLPLGVDGGVTFQSPVTLHARLNTSVDAPGALPEGLAPFTLFVQPEFVPAGAPAQMSFSFEISEEICDPGALPELAVHAFSEAEGWHVVPGQALDPAKHRLSGDLPAPATLAVLGPADLLKPAPPVAPPVSPGPLQTAGNPIPGAPMQPAVPQPAPPALIAENPSVVEPAPDAARGNKGQFMSATPGNAPESSTVERVGGRPRRKFNLERLDTPAPEPVPAEQAPAPAPPGDGPTGKRKFLMQLLDKVTPGKSSKPAGESPVPAPPPAEDPAPESAPPAETPEAPAAQPPPVPETAPPAAEAAPEPESPPAAPPETESPEETGTGQRVFKIEPVKP